MTLESVTPPHVALDLAARAPVIRLSALPVTRRLKVAWEWSAALMGLLVVVPLLLVLAMWIRLDSAGPVFFRQTRVGRNGVPFTLLKLRTMHVGMDDLLALEPVPDPEAMKRRVDPRVTRAGRVLRRLSLDELPQLFNVLSGKMALIGPRPPLPGEMPRFEDEVLPRFSVRPGLTGLWQVSGRADLDWCEATHLDLDYVENWSLRGDLWILVRTIPAVLGGRGAY